MALPFDRVLNLIYAELLKRIDPEKQNARLELDGRLGVSLWRSPLSRQVPQIPVEGPWWWRGDEEASDAFLQFAASQGTLLG